jgi:DNA repair ATPase RecN
MTSKTILIQEVLRQPEQGSTDRLAFKAGVNVIVGLPNTGKSKWLRMIDYLLGDDANPEDTFEELHDKYDSVQATCIIAGEKLTIERKWKEKGVKTKAFVNGQSIGVKELRELFMARLGLPLVHYPQGNPYGSRAWPELGWRSLCRHVYRRQSMWADLADQQPESEQHACLMQFLGIAPHLFSEEYANLVKKEKKIQELEFAKDQYLQMLEEVSREILDDKSLGVALTPQSMEAAAARIRQEIEQKQKTRSEILLPAARPMTPVVYAAEHKSAS